MSVDSDIESAGPVPQDAKRIAQRLPPINIRRLSGACALSPNLVDVVIDQPAKPWVLDQIEEHSGCAPDHQPAEVLSTLARLVRAGVLEPRIARSGIDEAQALHQEVPEPTSRSPRRRARW